jgi:hypothetical protein
MAYTVADKNDFGDTILPNSVLVTSVNSTHIVCVILHSVTEVTGKNLDHVFSFFNVVVSLGCLAECRDRR